MSGLIVLINFEETKMKVIKHQYGFNSIVHLNCDSKLLDNFHNFKKVDSHIFINSHISQYVQMGAIMHGSPYIIM